MMEYTDCHQRFLFSLLSKRSALYTEMVTANALVRIAHDAQDPNYGKRGIERFLEADFDLPNPLVLQLGGSDVEQMHEASALARSYGHSAININCGCPSDKVAGKGAFGAALMMQPELVSDLSLAVQSAMGVPPTIKCRIGVNDQSSYESLKHFITTIHINAGVTHFIGLTLTLILTLTLTTILTLDPTWQPWQP